MIINTLSLMKIVKDKINDIGDEIIHEIQEIQPIDDTTPEKAREIYERTGDRAWIRDDETAVDDWFKLGLYTSWGSIVLNIVNDSPYLPALALGKLHETEGLIGKKSVERTLDGRYSEQYQGNFVQAGVDKALKRRF